MAFPNPGLAKRQGANAAVLPRSLVVQNEGQRSVQILMAAHDGTYTLLPGDTVELEVRGDDGAFRLCFYDGGLQVAGEAKPKTLRPSA